MKHPPTYLHWPALLALTLITSNLSIAVAQGPDVPLPAQPPVNAQQYPAPVTPQTRILPAAPNSTLPNLSTAPTPLPNLQEERRRQLEQRLRDLLTNLGFQEAATQNALLEFLAEEERARQSVREAAKRLMVGLRREMPAPRLQEFISVYKGTLQTEATRRASAQLALDGKIGYSNNPRLEALLWVCGVLGEPGPGLSLQTLVNQQLPGAQMRVEGGLRSQPSVLSGIVVGTVLQKGTEWIDIKDGAGAERYTLRQMTNTVPEGGLDPAVLQTIDRLKAGDQVRIEWVRNDRKRVVAITPAP